MSRFLLTLDHISTENDKFDKVALSEASSALASKDMSSESYECRFDKTDFRFKRKLFEDCN